MQCFIADDKPDNRFNDGKCDLVSASSFYNDYTLRQLGQKVLSGKLLLQYYLYPSSIPFPSSLY